MLSSELNSRAKKIEREQKQRLEKEKIRAEKERTLEQRARERREKHEEEASRKRAAALAAAELVRLTTIQYHNTAASIAHLSKERLQHEEEVEFNNGVWWRAELEAVLITEEIAALKGIKRGADKITLPPSASNLLMAQDAPKNGALFFEVRGSNFSRTHAGLLDFTAAEGTVGIPPQVASSLWDGGTVGGDERVTVTYRRLEKGIYARFQPESADFQKEVAEAVEDVLVASLSIRSTISEGDWLPVAFGGRQYHLRVQQLRPSRQVSVIDTEMVAEVEPSIETEQRLKGEAVEQEQRRLRAEHLRTEAEAEREAQARQAVEEAARRERIRQEKEASLPPEPVSEPNTHVMIRFPDGSRHTRKFRHTDPVSLVFHFVDARGGGGLPPGTYRLATQFPRRSLSADHHASILQAGLDPRQEALMLEPISQESPV